jgi:hypothetical protein
MSARMTAWECIGCGRIEDATAPAAGTGREG